MAITVTATLSSGQSNANAPSIALKVLVLTGGVEAGGANLQVSNKAQGTITPSFSNSLLVWAVAYNNGTGAFGGAAANNSFDQNVGPDAFDGAGSGHFTGTVTAGTGALVGSNDTGTNGGAFAAYEIKAASGSTPSIDGSSPAGVTLAVNTGQSATTASFSPPPGSVLVALVAGVSNNFSGVDTWTVSDSSGLTWTVRAEGTSTVQGSQGMIFTATVPAQSSSPAGQYPPGRFAPLASKFPGVPFALPPSGPIISTAVVTAIQPVNAPITMKKPQLRCAPALRLTPGTQVPPIVVRTTRKTVPPLRVQPKQRLTTGMLPGKGLSGIPPMSHVRPRLVRLAVRPRGSISGPFAPGAVVIVTPTRPAVLAAPHRGPPRLSPSRLARGERGSLTVPVPRPVVLRCRQAPLLRSASRILPGQRGSLTVPIPVPVVLRNRQKIRPVQSRLIPGIVIPPFAYPSQPQPTIKTRTQYRLQRQPRMTLLTGMLPGKGLSGIPPAGHIRPRAARLVTRNSGTLRAGQRGSLTVPVPVPVVVRNKQRIRPVQSRLCPPPFVPAGAIYQAVSAPTIKVSTRYRLQRQPAQKLWAGMLPGKGLSGIPVQQTRCATAKIQRQPRQRITTGYPASLTVPVPVPVVLRNKNKVLRATSRLIPSPFAPAGTVYQPVIQRTQFVRPIWRFVRAPRMSLRTGMLPDTGLSGIPPFGHVRPRQAKAVPNVRSRIIPGPFVPTALGARPSSKPVLRYRLTRRDKGQIRTGMLPGRGLSGLPPTGHTRALPPRKVQRKPSERIRTGWIAWGIVASLPGQVTVTHSLSNTVTVVNSSATVEITNEDVSAVQTDNYSSTVAVRNYLANSVEVKDGEVST